MRVLHITETMAAGVLKYIHEVILADRRGDTKHFILYSPHRENTPKDLNKLFPSSVSLIEVNIKIRQLFQSMKALYRHIREINPDVIHLHSSIAGFLGRLVALLFPKIKVYYTPHGYSFLMTNKSNITRGIYWLSEFISSQLKGQIIACSKSEYRYAKDLSVLRKAFLLENSMKLLHIQNMKKTPRQIIGVGRMEDQKNPKLFVEIVSLLKSIDPTIKAIWIGDGTLKQECEQLNHLLNTEIIFTGWLSNSKTIELLQGSTLFLQTSSWEGLPYSVLEAFAVGLPVVASDIESHRDIIGNNYLGFIAENTDQYINYILKLLNDEELCYTISNQNRNKLEEAHFTFSNTIYSIYKGMSLENDYT